MWINIKSIQTCWWWVTPSPSPLLPNPSMNKRGYREKEQEHKTACWNVVSSVSGPIRNWVSIRTKLQDPRWNCFSGGIMQGTLFFARAREFVIRTVWEKRRERKKNGPRGSLSFITCILFLDVGCHKSKSAGSPVSRRCRCASLPGWESLIRSCRVMGR